MVRTRSLRLSLLTLALFGTRPALADPINLTGNVINDFSTSNPNVTITPVMSSPLDVTESGFIPGNGWVSGWAIKDIRTDYDPTTDTMFVGLNTFKNAAGQRAIVGDSDGNGNPGTASAQMAAVGGSDDAHLGGFKSVAVAFAPNSAPGSSTPGTPVVVAGVPADKTTAGTGIDGFNVAAYKNTQLGLGYDFGKTLTNNPGTLAFDPSAAHPGFEFTIANFSKIAGLNPQNGFWITAYAGSPNDVVAGEMSLGLTRLPALAAQNIPEPTTVLAWSLVVGGAVLRYRRSRATAA